MNEKVINRPNAGLVRDIKREHMSWNNAMLEMREINKIIKSGEGNEDIWHRKRELRAILNIYNK